MSFGPVALANNINNNNSNLIIILAPSKPYELKIHLSLLSDPADKQLSK